MLTVFGISSFGHVKCSFQYILCLVPYCTVINYFTILGISHCTPFYVKTSNV